MAENTKIEWTDHTFNPWIGCTKISPGCDGCYAARQDKFRKWTPEGWGGPRRRTKTWGDPPKWNKAHEAFYAAHSRRQRVFCASLADVFDNEVDPEWRSDLFKLILATPNLDWLLLTKRIGNVGNMLPVPFDFERHYPNVRIGTTIVNREEMLRDGPKLKALGVRDFWSVEPMLGELGAIPREMFPQWVICGGESGPSARPAHPDWFRSLRDQCAAAGVAYLFKQWGEWAPYDRGVTDSRTLATPGALDDPVQRFGKKLAGRLLDGVQHDGFPKS